MEPILAIKWILRERELGSQERTDLAGKAVGMRLPPGTGPRFFLGTEGLDIWAVSVDRSGEITLGPLDIAVSRSDPGLPPMSAITFSFARSGSQPGATRVIGGDITPEDYLRTVEYLMRPDPRDPQRRRTGLNVGGSLAGIRLHGTRKPMRTHMKAGTLLARIADEPGMRAAA